MILDEKTLTERGWPLDLCGTPQAKPFIPWMGGKRRFIPDIAKLLPEKIDVYYEPFLGGGAMYYYLEPRLNQPKFKASLSDSNDVLITTYQVVRDNVEALISTLKGYAKSHAVDPKRNYQSVKEYEPRDSVDTAARFIYLIQTSYKNMWSVNKNGKFSNTIGDKTGNKICDADALREASRALKRAMIASADFESDFIDPYEDDFVFCDPPYDSTYDRYAKSGFTRKDQNRLCERVMYWSRERGAKVMIFNSDTEFIRQIYGDTDRFAIHPVTSKHKLININEGGPGRIGQVIITTYGLDQPTFPWYKHDDQID